MSASNIDALLVLPRPDRKLLPLGSLQEPSPTSMAFRNPCTRFPQPATLPRGQKLQMESARCLHSRTISTASLLRMSFSPQSHLRLTGAPLGRRRTRSEQQIVAVAVAERSLTEPGLTPGPGRELDWLPNFPVHYTLREQIGRGSFGTVHLATERHSGGEVAVKIIPKQRNGTTAEHILAKIQQEVEILRRMQGRPQALRLHAVFEDADSAYIVTEVCKGGTLEGLLMRQGALTEREAAKVLHDVLSVLAECHRQHISYADVKPANFLLKGQYPDARSLVECEGVQRDIEVRVADFGCSQLISANSKLGKKTGTPLYMAPELFMRYWGVQSDMWGIGMLLFQMLAGRLPFWQGPRAPNPMAVMQSILSEDIRFDGPAWAAISPEAVDLVTRLLDRDYNSRITAAEALQHPWLLQWCANEEGCSVVNDAVSLHPHVRRLPSSPAAGSARHH